MCQEEVRWKGIFRLDHHVSLWLKGYYDETVCGIFFDIIRFLEQIS